MSDWACLDSLFETTVTLAAVDTSTSGSLYGVPAYSTSTRTLNAHHTRGRRDSRDQQGMAIAVSGTVWVKSTATISPSDKITLADGSTPPIVNVSHWADENGLFGARLDLGF